MGRNYSMYKGSMLVYNHTKIHNEVHYNIYIAVSFNAIFDAADILFSLVVQSCVYSEKHHPTILTPFPVVPCYFRMASDCFIWFSIGMWHFV